MLVKRTDRATGFRTIALVLGLITTVAWAIEAQRVGTDLSSTVGNEAVVNEILSANRGSNGGGDQSLQFGDTLIGTADADLLTGGLGIDIIAGGAGDDVLIGGTEDFNPLNRDRAFGGDGDDVFVWAPGDGNDFFNGGSGIDVLMMGVIGETRDADGNTLSAPFFNVSPPNTAGSQDFDGVFVDPSSGLPIVDVAGGPGFCEIVDGSADATEASELAALGLDRLVRFFLRAPAADPTNPDTGLRIAMHLQSTEFLVCGSQTAGVIEVFDLRTIPATRVDVADLPVQAFGLIR